MEGESNSGLFVNDGSFLERFKQLQQQQQKEQVFTQGVMTGVSLESANSFKTSLTVKKAISFKPTVKPAPAPANGKFAFSLKQKSKLAAPPVKLGGDEDESEDGKRGVDRQSKRLKLEASNTAEDLQDAPQNESGAGAAEHHTKLEKAACAYDFAAYYLRGSKGKLYFPLSPLEIPCISSLSPPEIQDSSAKFATEEWSLSPPEIQDSAAKFATEELSRSSEPAFHLLV